MNFQLCSVFRFLSLSFLILLTSLSAPGKTPEFDKKFGAYTQQSGPGFAAMVIKNGSVIYKKGFGFASLKKSSQRPLISPTTNFNLASNSKQFTAMGVLI